MLVTRISAAALVGCFFLVAPINAADWKPLFNGKDLSGWRPIDGPTASWGVDDGLLICSGQGSGWLSTDKEYADFELELEYRVPAGGNSGVFLRAPHQGNPAFAGMEIQVLDDYDAQYANLKPTQYTGSLYDVVPRSRASRRKQANGRRCTSSARGTVSK